MLIFIPNLMMPLAGRNETSTLFPKPTRSNKKKIDFNKNVWSTQIKSKKLNVLESSVQYFF